MHSFVGIFRLYRSQTSLFYLTSYLGGSQKTETRGQRQPPKDLKDLMEDNEEEVDEGVD